MSEKIITFSIAAYNIEKFIDKCVTSMLSVGKNDEIEILIVDDGSVDKTSIIALDYEKKYPDTVRLIKKENGGHGSTVNTGIKEARGKYFRPVDGDDWVYSHDAKELIERLKSCNSDIVLCNYTECYSTRKVRNNKFKHLEDGREYSIGEIKKNVDWMGYHSVIFRTDILLKNNIKLDEHCFYVDTELMAFPIPFVNSVRFYDLNIYCYCRENEGQSVSEESRIKNILHSKKVAIHLLKFLKKNEALISSEKREYLYGGIAGHCIWHFKGLMFFAPDNKKKNELVFFDNYVKKVSPEVFELMAIPAKNRFETDTKLVKQMRLFNYNIYNLYGVCIKAKTIVRDIIRTKFNK